MENETIAMRIIKVVNKLGGNMSEFARKIDVTPAYISKLSKQPEKCRPSALVINAVCEKFKVNRDWLLTGKGGEDVVFDTAPESDIDKILKALKPEARDRILIKNFLALPEEGRQAVMRYALSVAAAAQEEIRDSAVHKDSIEAAEADYRSSSGYVANMDLSASNITGGTVFPNDKVKEETTTESGGGENGNAVG